MTAPVHSEDEEVAMDACYVYGLVPESQTAAEVEDLPAVGDPKASVSFVRHGEIAAVVSSIRTNRPLGTPEDLRAHAGTLDALASQGTIVLPFRFGTVVKDTESVTKELLADSHDTFLAALDRLRGKAQFTLKAIYEQETVLREILDEQPDINELRESLAEVSEDAGYYERIRLGELVSQAITEKREADTEEIQECLAPLALGTTTSEPAADDGVVDTNFLVEDARRADFEKAAEDLAGRWHGRIRLRLLGPLPPYDFAADAMGDSTEGG